jgi:hypothetical protein
MGISGGRSSKLLHFYHLPRPQACLAVLCINVGPGVWKNAASIPHIPMVLYKEEAFDTQFYEIGFPYGRNASQALVQD